MLYYTCYLGHEPKILGKRKKIDNTVYTFDIETTSYFLLNGKIFKGIDYLTLSEEEKKEAEPKVCMYIWMFSVNEQVFYGRTWEEFYHFMEYLNECVPEKKIVFVHNLGFEFHFFKSILKIKDVFARKAHKVIKCSIEDFNIEFRCSYMMSNCALNLLTKLYNLPVEKKKGDLDYTLLRHSKTLLTEKELGYCENDCLVVYYYILEELKTYERVDNIPITSTGHVRRELKELVRNDSSYKNKVKKSINIDPHIYNILIEAFSGGYTHANFMYADEIIENVDSYDFTSSYPYVMISEKYPSTEFKKCNIKKKSDMNDNFAYLLVVKFTNIKSKYYNNYISASKCKEIRGARYDNRTNYKSR